MLNKIITSLLLLTSSLHGDILEINEINEIRPHIIDNALYLFDIDDTLIDNPSSIGSPPWRSWAKSKISNHQANFVMFDALTLFIAKNAPYKTVEPSTAEFIAHLQNHHHTALAFTARGRSQWYTTDLEGVDRFTQAQLNNVGIDFSHTHIPQELMSLDPTYYCEGIIYSRNLSKGNILKHLFKNLTYRPSAIIFVDDRLEHVKSVEDVVKGMGIPYIGFWYRRSKIDRANFSPTAANIQLEALLQTGEIISNEVAQELSQTRSSLDINEILQATDVEQKFLLFIE